MKTTIYFIMIVFFSRVVGAADSKTCAQVRIGGVSCENLKIDFDLKNCSPVQAAKKVKIRCHGDEATATTESDAFRYKVDVKRYVGKLNNAVWDIVGEVQKSPLSKKPTVRTPAQAKPEIEKASIPTPLPTHVDATVTPTPTPFAPTLKSNGLLQFWYLDDSSQAAINSNTNFRVRRAEVKLSGASTDFSRWFLTADFAKAPSTTSTTVVTSATPETKTAVVTGTNPTGDNKVLQDIGIAIRLTEGLEVTFGQFKVQTASESLQSSGDLLFAERSLLARTYGERRDPGAMVSFKCEQVKASVMMSNGQGPNVDDKNTTKDLSSRIEANLPLGVTMGAFGLAKEFVGDDLDRYGFDVSFKSSDFFLKAELANGNNRIVRSTANVFDASYMISEKWQLATRYETVKPNVTDTLRSSTAVVGVNYYLLKNSLKMQLNHTQMHNMTGANGSYTPSADQKGSLITFGVQSSF